MFSIVAEKLLLENILVVDYASVGFGKIQSSDVTQSFNCEPQSQWSHLEFVCIIAA